MKKTLIAILALSSMAFAAEFTKDTAAGILYRDTNGDFVTTGGVTFDNGTNTLTFADTVFTYTEVTSKGTTQDRIKFTLGLRIDMSKVGTLTTGTKVITTGTGTDMGIGMTANKEYATVWGNNVPWVSGGAEAKTAAIAATEEVTLIFSTSGSGSTHVIEGQTFNSSNISWSWAGLKGTQAGLNSFVINDAFKDAILAVGVWQDSTTYNGNGGAAEFAAISSTLKNIPEPATATLSLLALAGLAARRRRH